MNNSQVAANTRTLIVLVSGILIANGASKIGNAINSEDVIGALTSILTALWAHYSHSDAAIIKKADAITNPTSESSKAVLAIVFFFLFAFCLSASAQTNAPALVPTNSITSDLKKLFEDDAAFFGTNQTVTIDVGGLYSDKKFGGLLDVHTPLPLGTNGQVSAGVSVAYLDGQFYSATLSIKGGTTVKVPVIGDVFMWSETGPGLNMHSGAVISQTFAGGTKGFDIYKGFWLYVSAFAGDISDRPGTAYGGALSTTIKF